MAPVDVFHLSITGFQEARYALKHVVKRRCVDKTFISRSEINIECLNSKSIRKLSKNCSKTRFSREIFELQLQHDDVTQSHNPILNFR